MSEISRVEASKREKTRERIASKRESYLRAVAAHYSDVSITGMDMECLCRPNAWDKDTMEHLLSVIEKSHIENFGVSLGGSLFGGEDAEQPEGLCAEEDGCPTEIAVLKRFWRSHNNSGMLESRKDE